MRGRVRGSQGVGQTPPEPARKAPPAREGRLYFSSVECSLRAIRIRYAHYPTFPTYHNHGTGTGSQGRAFYQSASPASSAQTGYFLSGRPFSLASKLRQPIAHKMGGWRILGGWWAELSPNTSLFALAFMLDMCSRKPIGGGMRTAVQTSPR